QTERARGPAGVCGSRKVYVRLGPGTSSASYPFPYPGDPVTAPHAAELLRATHIHYRLAAAFSPFGASTPCSGSVVTSRVRMSTTRTRCPFVSATYILSPTMLSPPGSLNVALDSQPPRSPTNVWHSRFAGSITLILLLYVSATYSSPSRYATPSACCSRTFSPTPSTSPNSNSPSPTIVFTLPSPDRASSRMPLIAVSATYRFLPSLARPLGWAKDERSSGPSLRSSRPSPASPSTPPLSRPRVHTCSR